MADLETLKKQRTSAKSRLTIAANKITSLDSFSTKHVIEIAIEQFDAKLALYDNIQAQIEAVVSPEGLDLEIEESEGFRSAKLETLAEGRQLLEQCLSSVAAPAPTTASTGSVTGMPSVYSLHPSLPKIELPYFSGDYTCWQAFYDKFNAIVHSNSQLPTISKFTYLQSLLKGEAASAICGLSLTETNYDFARTILEQRFGRKERIIFSHIQALLNMSTPGRSTSELWALHDSLQTHVRSLEGLGINGCTYGVILTPLVLHKLPENIRLEWARLGQGKEWDLEALLQFLQDEITRRERSLAKQP